MYKVLDGITPPEDEATLWRYMSFEEFVSILKKESLSYTRAYKFEDIFEGFTPQLIRDSYKKSLNRRTPPAHRPGVIKILEIKDKYVMCNCWHQSEEESKVMWDNYGVNNDSVAIKTTMGKMKKSLSDTDFDVFIGKIKYLSQRAYDEHYIPNFQKSIENGLGLDKKWTYFPYFHKREEFECEREVRIIIDIDRFIENCLKRLPAEDIEDTEFLECEFPDFGEKRKLFKVDVNTLINEIITSPNADDRITQKVKSVVQKYEFNFEVNPSILLNNPSSMDPYIVEAGEKSGTQLGLNEHYERKTTVSNQSISELSDQEILGMELESLAYLFLLDRSKIPADVFSVTDFLRDLPNNRDNAPLQALCEAFQWLYNNGYIMLNLADIGSGYKGFVTRAGKKWLDEKGDEG